MSTSATVGVSQRKALKKVNKENNKESKIQKIKASKQRTAELTVLPTKDWSIQQQIFNSAPSHYPKDKTVAELFEECVNNNSNKIALFNNDESYTYHELNVKANQLANYLRKAGVGPNSLVALYLERSAALIISILAIVKAGGIYLPLSTEDPMNRIRTILQDSNPVKILSNTTLHKNLCEIGFAEDQIIRIDAFFQEKIEHQDQSQVCLNSPLDPIYVMYTSGSSGKPKGCVIPHRAVVSLVKNANYVNINSEDNIAQIANVAFDAMTFELWGALLNGASLHIIPQITLLSPVDFADSLKRNKITIMFITATLLNLVVKDSPDAFDNIKYLLFGGEKANPEIIKTLLKRKQRYHLKNLNLINAYGPTESTTFALTFLAENVTDLKVHVPIGRTISNTKAYVLNEKLEFIGPGEIGELYLGGDGLALGYLNDPKQTIAKYIQSPWNSEEKLYKTGDLVYWQHNVGVVYIDREDSQVKINGFRVELSEIEACMVKNRYVKQAVVVVQQDAEDRKELIAYVCFHPNNHLNLLQFHQYLKENIPYYMMPRKTIQIDYIPVTANGKADKSALVKMNGRNILETNSKNIPINQVEKIITEVWQQLLDTVVNRTQNFFDLGAHSLMLGRACALLNMKLHAIGIKPISILNILNHPTVHSLAMHASEREEAKVDDLKNAIERAIRQRKALMSRKSLHAVSV